MLLLAIMLGLVRIMVGSEVRFGVKVCLRVG